MQFLLSLLTISLASPIAIPDRAEMKAAHSNPVEFLKVHSPAGLADKALFQAAHNPNAPNPANSAAAKNAKRDLSGLRKREISDKMLDLITAKMLADYNKSGR